MKPAARLCLLLLAAQLGGCQLTLGEAQVGDLVAQHDDMHVWRQRIERLTPVYWGVTLLDRPRPLGAAFCIADRRFFVASPRLVGPNSLKPLGYQSVLPLSEHGGAPFGVALKPCGDASAQDFRPASGALDEAELPAALSAVLDFSEGRAHPGVPTRIKDEARKLLRRENFHGVMVLSPHIVEVEFSDSVDSYGDFVDIAVTLEGGNARDMSSSEYMIMPVD
jgi:hypothetical protein